MFPYPLINYRTDPETSGGENSEVPLSPPAKVPTVEFKLVEDLRLVTIPVTSCLLVLMFYVGLGTVLFASWEGWNLLDGAYFCFISLMTIGFGDFVPGNKYIYQVTDNISEQVSDEVGRSLKSLSSALSLLIFFKARIRHEPRI